MTYKTHAAFGAAFTAGIMAMLGFGFMPAVAVFGALGGIIPDVDHDKSKVSNMNFAFRAVGIVYRVLLRVVAFLLGLLTGVLKKLGVKMAHTTGGHRGPLTHSLAAVAIFAAIFSPLASVSPYWYAGLLLGILSHILIDSLNPQGTPILWPFHVGVRNAQGQEREFRLHLLPRALSPTTGTGGETFVFVLVLILLVLLMVDAASTSGLGVMDIAHVFPWTGLPTGGPIILAP